MSSRGFSRRKLLSGFLGAGAVAGLFRLSPWPSPADAVNGRSGQEINGAGVSPIPGAESEAWQRCRIPVTPARAAGDEDSFVAMSLADQPAVVGEVDTSVFDPIAFLADFDYGQISVLPNGQTLREYDFVARDEDIEVAPGVFFPAWTYNGTVPGPTIRCTQGDRIRIRFLNGSRHPHTIHFHGIHPANMDGSLEIVPTGGKYTYEFDAEPYGLHLYHCHSHPLKKHIHKGLYGTFIIDPPGGRPPAKELVMVMNAFDTNFDGENEVYAVNTVAHHYLKHPIPLKIGELVRIYLVNITEFDLINSFHLHANFFDVYRTGTRLETNEFTDTIMLCQAERAILEFSYKAPGSFLFHAHQSEFAELGWLGAFEVTV